MHQRARLAVLAAVVVVAAAGWLAVAQGAAISPAAAAAASVVVEDDGYNKNNKEQQVHARRQQWESESGDQQGGDQGGADEEGDLMIGGGGRRLLQQRSQRRRRPHHRLPEPEPEYPLPTTPAAAAPAAPAAPTADTVKEAESKAEANEEEADQEVQVQGGVTHVVDMQTIIKMRNAEFFKKVLSRPFDSDYQEYPTPPAPVKTGNEPKEETGVKKFEAKPGEIRERLSNDCLTADPLDKKIYTFYCRGSPRQQWAITPTGQIATADLKLCIDGSNIEENGELLLAPCDTESAEQRWEFAGQKSIWLPTGMVQSVTRERLCMTPSLYPYVKSDPPTVKLRACHMICKQMWQVKALHVETEELTAAPQSAYPRKDLLAEKKPSERPDGRLMCWVMTNPKNHATKAKAISETWGPYCHVLLFVSTEEVPGLNTVVLNLGHNESRHYLWKKSKLAWMYSYYNYFDQADWFIRADDDTYFMMDNLQKFLSDFKSSDKHFFGRRFTQMPPFYGGGSGTIMSKAALGALGEAVDRGEDPMRVHDTFADDMEIAYAMKKLGIFAVDTRDEDSRQRFMGIGIDAERSMTRAEGPDNWFWKYSPEAKEGFECCSVYWVSSHYTDHIQMYYYDDMHAVGCEAAGRDPMPESFLRENKDPGQEAK
eukprot:m.211690 g.211690  ORF g.211690 m.211690 type:complete len:654 (+) comp18729_c0_seq1:109-2070(+)